MLRARLLPSGRPGTWQPFWPDDPGAKLVAALADLASPSLFGGAQVLVVRRAEGLRDADQDAVLAALPAIGPGTTLILVSRSADQRRKLFAACVKAGVAYGFPPLDRRGAAVWVGRLARERGSDISPAAIEVLLDRSGTDLGVLTGEVEKLVTHAGNKTKIEPAHVATVAAGARAFAVEELSDRIAQRDLPGAARALRHLLAAGEPPLRALAFLAANLRRALHVAELSEEGARPDAIATRLGMPPWLVTRNLNRGRASDLRRALHVLHRLDQDLKNSRPERAVFEAALLDIVHP